MSRAASRGVRASARSSVSAGRSNPSKQSDDANSIRATLARYFIASERPLAGLLFVLPMMVVYEVGTRWYATDPTHATEQRVIAFTLMRRFIDWRHRGNVPYLPCFAILSVMLAIQIARREAWVVKASTLIGMAFESVLLALPLLLLGQAVVEHMSHTTLAGIADGDRAMIITFMGAGVYEEAVFRVGGIALLSLLFRDTLRLRPAPATALTVVCSGILFSLYHYLGSEPFQWPSFVFRAIAGVYFSVLYLGRGFGVTAGSHAAYDLLAWSFS